MQSLPGVANVEIDADARTATVSVEAGKFDAARAVAALKNSGFPADSVKSLGDTEAAEADATAEPEDTPADAAESEEAAS